MTSSHAPDLSARNLMLPAWVGALQLPIAAFGVVCIAAAAALAFTGNVPSDAFFWKAYLQNLIFLFAISLGGLFFVFLQHLTRAGWSVAVRRPAEILASNLRWLWILFVVPFGILWLQNRAGLVWEWADMETLAANKPEEAHLVEGKVAFLNPTFFWIRAILYFVIWASLAHFFYSRSLQLGVTGDIRESKRMQLIAAPAAILWGVSISFAAVDWMMSLSPAWFSTMFGVYFFTGCCTVGFAGLILACVAAQASGVMKGIISLEHYQDLGKMLFAFGMVFWAYIAYSQYMLIWYANIPEETGWYLARQIGGWRGMSLLLLFGHFLIPFFAFMSKWPKRMPHLLAAGAGWMLLIGWIDIYWLVHPVVPHDIAHIGSYPELQAKYADEPTHVFHPVNWLLLFGMLGLFVSGSLSQMRRHPLLCAKDPRLAESLNFENI
ncbi:MAG: quinol:cytochrome C oxidoreductase [Phycisphaerae bacterium]|nr:quinol:cytochrome C oxidoreductase [Phycisphaerae bacterium]